MKLPKQLQKLYRHWGTYTFHKTKADIDKLFIDKEILKEISSFIQERINIWERKTKGESRPYTKDEILGTYRFCNIYREFDRQTIEFHTLLNPVRDDFPLWLLNMFYCRMVARTETINKVGLLSFDEKENKKLYDRLMKSNRPRYGTPYVFPISAIQRSEYPTRESFICFYLPKIIKEIAKEISRWDKESVVNGLEKVIQIFRLNLSFLWTEVLIDVAYQYPEHLDLFKQFPIGPGSLPTMKRINPNIEPTILVELLAKGDFDTGITINKKKLRLSAENWEGIGCEFRKYTNLKQGKGRRRLYRL